MYQRRSTTLALLAILLGACSGEEKSVPQRDAGPDLDAGKLRPTPAALLPQDENAFAPSLVHLPSQGPVDGAHLADVKTCGNCHPDVLAQQQGSAHALASFNNPVYRMAIDRLRREVGAQATHLCAGCHDPALLIDQAMNAPVRPSDARAMVGLSCRLCHGIDTATQEGNGSYFLSHQALVLPSSTDQSSVARHKEMARPLASASLCGSCHQSFLSPASGNATVLAGQNELSSWRDSAYSGSGAARIDSVAKRSCRSCHMPRVEATLGDMAAGADGMIASHAFLGGHSWLAAMQGRDEKVQEVREFLKGAVSIDLVPRMSHATEVVVDVVVRNLAVGHHFPAGVRDAANTWIEVDVVDANGHVLLRSESGNASHRLMALVADDQGHLLEGRETHRFAGLIADHSIAPRDVAVIRYRGQIGYTEGIEIRARLLHQSRSPALATAACVDSRRARGRAFASAGAQLDACKSQPTTLIAEVTRDVAERTTTFDRSYEHGLGLLHQVQERVGEAEPSLMRALALASNQRERAMARLALAKVWGRQGRAQEALKALEQVEALLPESPALFAARGDVLARVWRWQEAALAYGQALEAAESNASLWRRYAIALGSLGQQEKALAAAGRGLRLQPRDADLLRVQALALRELAAGDATEAMQAYEAYRGPDNIGNLRLLCARESERCAREALPIHEHRLVP